MDRRHEYEFMTSIG